MDVLPFEEWLSNNHELAKKEFLDFEDGIECPHCDGYGKLTVHMDDMIFLNHMRQLYEAHVKADVDKLATRNKVIAELATARDRLGVAIIPDLAR